MDKRFFLALVLTGVVLMVTPLIFQTPAPTTFPATSALNDPGGAATVPTVGGELPTRAQPAPQRPTSQRQTIAAAPTRVAADTIEFTTPTARYEFSSLGATPISIVLNEYESLAASTAGEPAVLRDGFEPLLRFHVVTSQDTLRLDRVDFRGTITGSGETSSIRFTSADPSLPATIEYGSTPTPHLTHVQVQVGGLPARAFLLLGLPSGFNSQEADTLDDIRHLSYSAKPVARRAEGTSFSSLDPGERELVTGGLSWAVAKSKYFVVGALSTSDATPFAEMQIIGGRRETKLATRGNGTVVIPVVNGFAEFDLYAGPQSWEGMRALGREFETANPYGGFMQPIVQPFATIVMRLMLWLKRVVQLDYGWVLVIFGLAIRIVLWPLNQSAMRASIRLQRIQPELQAVQAKYKSDKTKQQQEMMRVYQEHNMSPFSALSGCLPALIPMPVFFALFFVFQNTIEFRGVPFLWLADISLRDPLYVLPVVTGASMFLLSWIGMRNMPKNPQATMMLYLMPGMFTVFLLSTASGLSIYYLVQQIAAIPQQWMIANERRKAVTTK
ncbi:MAG: YidC/Oxa1 family insertase periplasmic-domain containing protein [Gemmatimonadetes bacterium]|nr:YidC/Oxa1 family insertase periplasmic-domain containing protein [Gemmatimonadota bacterium]